VADVPSALSLTPSQRNKKTTLPLFPDARDNAEQAAHYHILGL
jgi:hypothetical protein